MHVAILGSRGYPSTYSGFETLIRRLAPFLVADGFEVTVYGRRRMEPGQGFPFPDGLHTVTTRGLDSTSASTLSYGWSSFLDARRRRFDAALVVNVANGMYLPLLRRAGIPTVVNVDGLEWQRAKWSRAGKAVFRLGARATARWADEIVIDAEALRPTWGEQFPVDANFIPYGADVVRAVSTDPLERLGLEAGGYVLAVARMVPENNVDLLIDSMRHLPGSLPIVLVGSGPAGSPLVERVDEETKAGANLHALGHVSDQMLLASLWAHCGAYWHGHSVGGTNPSLLQALGHGAPTLALDTEFNREVLFPHVEQLVPHDAVELAAGVMRLMDDPSLARQWSRSGQDIVKSRYQWDAVCRAYGEVLRSLGR